MLLPISLWPHLQKYSINRACYINPFSSFFLLLVWPLTRSFVLQNPFVRMWLYCNFTYQHSHNLPRCLNIQSKQKCSFSTFVFIKCIFLDSLERLVYAERKQNNEQFQFSKSSRFTCAFSIIGGLTFMKAQLEIPT